MKLLAKYFRYFIFLFLFIAYYSIAGEKQNITQQRIAMVDFRKIEEQSLSEQTIRDQANELREQYQKEVAALENSLREEHLKLAEEKKKGLSESEIEIRERSFSEKEMQLRQLSKRRKYQWEQAISTAKEEFLKIVVQVVEEVAKKNQYSYVLLKNAVLYYDPSADITDKVIKVLNDKIKKIEVKVPQVSSKKLDD